MSLHHEMCNASLAGQRRLNLYGWHSSTGELSPTGSSKKALRRTFVAQATLNTVSEFIEHSPEGRTEYAVACSQVLHARICSPLQPRNRPAAYIVGSPNLPKRLVAMIAALNRVALLMIGEFRPPPHLHTPRLGALFDHRPCDALNPVLWDLVQTLTPLIMVQIQVPQPGSRGPFRTHRLRFIPETSVTLLVRRGYRAVRSLHVSWSK